MDPWCLPWWHNQVISWISDTRAVTDCPAKNDQVPKKPPELLREAQETARLLGARPPGIQAYSLARALASETDGAATAEELVLIGEVIVNESLRRKTDPASLLLAGGSYGKGADRFAATDKDPGAGHLAVATFVLSGQSDRFARGACAYVRPIEVNDMPKVVAFLNNVFSEEKWGWAGHFPNVDPRRLFVLVPLKSASVDQIDLNRQGLTDLATNSRPPAPQITGPAPGEKQPIDWLKVGKVAAIAAVGSLVAVGTSYAVAEVNTKRWKDWEPTQTAGEPGQVPELQPDQLPGQTPELTPGNQSG